MPTRSVRDFACWGRICRGFTFTLSDQPLPRLPDDLGLLEEAVVRADARLVVMDPLPAFLASSAPLTSDEPLRNLLHAVALLAERTRCAFLMVRHLTKKPGRQPLYRGTGSIALIAACRLALLVAPHPADPTRTIMAQSKNNLAPLQPSLAYRLFPSGEKSAAPLQWLGPVAHTAVELTQVKEFSASRARAVRFLTNFLRTGPQTTVQIFAAGKNIGLQPRTLQRTFHDLSLKKRCVHRAGRTLTYWFLPEHRGPEVAGEEMLDLDRWLPDS